MASSKILTEWQTCYWNALASEVSIKVPVLTYIMPLQNTFSKLCSAAFLILFEFVGLLRCKIFFKVCLFGLNSYPLFLHTPAQNLSEFTTSLPARVMVSRCQYFPIEKKGQFSVLLTNSQYFVPTCAHRSFFWLQRVVLFNCL